MTFGYSSGVVCVGMKSVEELRREAARARRLLSGVTDPLSTKLLTEYAGDCDAQADRLESGERGRGANPDDS